MMQSFSAIYFKIHLTWITLVRIHPLSKSQPTSMELRSLRTWSLDWYFEGHYQFKLLILLDLRLCLKFPWLSSNCGGIDDLQNLYQFTFQATGTWKGRNRQIIPPAVSLLIFCCCSLLDSSLHIDLPHGVCLGFVRPDSAGTHPQAV